MVLFTEENSCDPKASLAHDLSSILSDEKLDRFCDVKITGPYRGTVRASRLLLAARSPVFRRLFMEDDLPVDRATGRAEVYLDFPRWVTETVVSFCYCGAADLALAAAPACDDVRDDDREPGAPHRRETEAERVDGHMRMLVRLVGAAEHFRLSELKRLATCAIFEISAVRPCVLCPVLDEAVTSCRDVANIALEVIGLDPGPILLPEGRPAGRNGGGLVALGTKAMRKIAGGNFLCCNEETVFNILHAWADLDMKKDIENRRKYALADTSTEFAISSTGTEVLLENSGAFTRERWNSAKAICASTINLHKIRPEVLIAKVAKSGFVSHADISTACRKQKRYAKDYGENTFLFSAHRNTRNGNDNVVVVVGAGVSAVNGLYRKEGNKFIGRNRSWNDTKHFFFIQKMDAFAEELRELDVCPCLETRYSRRGVASWILYAVAAAEMTSLQKYICLYECAGNRAGDIHPDGFFKPMTDEFCSSHNTAVVFRGEHPCGKHLHLGKEEKETRKKSEPDNREREPPEQMRIALCSPSPE